MYIIHLYTAISTACGLSGDLPTIGTPHLIATSLGAFFVGNGHILQCRCCNIAALMMRSHGAGPPGSTGFCDGQCCSGTCYLDTANDRFFCCESLQASALSPTTVLTHCDRQVAHLRVCTLWLEGRTPAPVVRPPQYTTDAGATPERAAQSMAGGTALVLQSRGPFFVVRRWSSAIGITSERRPAWFCRPLQRTVLSRGQWHVRCQPRRGRRHLLCVSSSARDKTYSRT